jgi:membrane-associated phospholipid phosphatase
MKKLSRATLLAVAAATPLYLLLYWLADRPAVRLARDHFAGTWVYTLAEVVSFPGDTPVAPVLLALALLAAVGGHFLPGGQERRWPVALFYIWTSVFVASLAGQILKILLGRCRPELLFASGRYGLTFFATRWELTSTPSSHTILAFSSLTALSLLFPRGRIVFLALALLAGAARVALTAHYPSDVLFGAMIGIVSALWFHRLFYPPEFPAGG